MIKVTIEDNEEVRSLLTVSRELESFRKCVLNREDNCFETINVIAREKPDLILLDVNIPGLDNFKFVKELRSMPDILDTKILISSGMLQAAKSMQNEVNDFIIKPILPNELIQKNIRIIKKEKKNGEKT
jgi:CheY-like chemotaxis protein